MRIDLTIVCQVFDVADLRFENIKRSRRISSGNRIDEDHCVIGIEQRVSKIEPADAEIDNPHPFGQGSLG